MLKGKVPFLYRHFSDENNTSRIYLKRLCSLRKPEARSELQNTQAV